MGNVKNLIYEELYLTFKEKDFSDAFEIIKKDEKFLSALIGSVLADFYDMQDECDKEQKTFDLEKQLLNDGFEIDNEKEEHSTYKKDGLYVRIYWDGDVLNDEGCCISMSIYKLNESIENLFFGKRPANKNEYDILFNLINF